MWKLIKRTLIGATVLILIGTVTLLWALHASRAQLDGELTLAGLSAAVTISRDANGVATVRASNQLDAARALGFLHAQERFFQMDLNRRAAAGELSELFGPVAVDHDSRVRKFQFRQLASRVVANVRATGDARLDAYSEGVNNALKQLTVRPPEYLALRQAPTAWTAEDSILVSYAMFMDLNDEEGRLDLVRGWIEAAGGQQLRQFLAPIGTEFDATPSNDLLPELPIPSLSAAHGPQRQASSRQQLNEMAEGSNNWAVGGALTEHGGAMLADDMHLGLSVPNTWYRVQLLVGQTQAIGVTLPGLGLMVVGSNGHVAWGYTNSYADVVDRVLVEPGQTSGTYRTNDGDVEFVHHHATINVAGGDPQQTSWRSTRWGPVTTSPFDGKDYAIRWTALSPAATNLGLAEVIGSRTTRQAVEIFAAAGMPSQNVLIVDSGGDLAWVLSGLLPDRPEGCSGLVPQHWSQADNCWRQFLPAKDKPKVINPPDHRLWSANSRVAALGDIAQVGDGGYTLGARGAQIRDRLNERQQFDEQAMLSIQLDDEARFLSRWYELALSVASSMDDSGIQTTLSQWSGHARVDDPAYRLVRAFRLEVIERMLTTVATSLDKTVPRADPEATLGSLRQTSPALWRVIEQQRTDWLPPGTQWQAFLSDALLKAHDDTGGGDWGNRNTLRMQHPLARAIPALSGWLDMEAIPLPGDSHMPRVQSPTFGASQRLVVAPGRERSALFHMPGGQSGHFLSPFYRAGHDDWAQGRPSPLLPGESVYHLVLQPK